MMEFAKYGKLNLFLMINELFIIKRLSVIALDLQR